MIFEEFEAEDGSDITRGREDSVDGMAVAQPSHEIALLIDEFVTQQIKHVTAHAIDAVARAAVQSKPLTLKRWSKIGVAAAPESNLSVLVILCCG